MCCCRHCCCCQLSLDGAEPVRVPFALPAATHNEAQFQFLVNSISMPQKLKGTLTYIAKVTCRSFTALLYILLHCGA